MVRHPRVGTLEIGLLVLTITVITAFRVANYQGWVFPASDYYQYRQMSLSMAEGGFPADAATKRGPALPGLMALLAAMMPGPDSHLHAATALSLLGGTLLIVFLWRVARDLLSAPAALVVPWLYAYNNELTSASLQPYTDALCACFVIAAFMLDRKRSPWTYGAVALAALFRYQAILLVPAFLVRDLLVGPRSIPRAVYAVAALLPAGAWILAGVTLGSSSAPGVGGAGGSGGAILHTTFLKLMGAATLGVLPRSYGEAVRDGDAGALAFGTLCLLAIAVIAVLGIRYLWAKHRNRVLPMLLFGLALTVLHLRFPWGPTRYALPLLWIVYLFFVAGLEAWVARGIGTGRRGRALTRCAVVGAAGGAGLLICFIAWPPQWALSWWSLVFSLPLVGAALLLMRGTEPPRIRGRNAVAALCLIAPAVLLSAGAYDYTAYAMDRDQTAYAGLRPAAEWMQLTLRPDDRVLIPPGIIGFLTTPPLSLSEQKLMQSSQLPTGSAAEALGSADTTYALWPSSSADAITRGIDMMAEDYSAMRWDQRRYDVFESLVAGLDGWRELRRFEHRGNTAVIYQRWQDG